MENEELNAAKARIPGSIKRKAINFSQVKLVKEALLREDTQLPLVITPALEGVNLLSWSADQKEFLHAQVLKYGGVLLRGFSVASVEEFERFVSTVSVELLEYRERSSPRSRVNGNIYTSTDHPPDQPIFLHNESSYSHVWPLKIFFHCITPAQEGGETPLADSRKIFSRIDPAIRERFRQKGVLYVRNFGDGMGLPWQTVFQTDNRAQVEQYCQSAGIRAEWKDNNRLRTYKVGRAILRHPQTREMVWFNHATFFHVSTLAPAIREELLAVFKEEDLPTNTYYGDGSPIEPSVLDELRAIYAAETVSFPWQAGDILMLDNMLTAHGRTPFKGARKVVVGMSQPMNESLFLQ